MRSSESDMGSNLSRDIVNDYFDESLKKAMNANQQLVKGEISDEEKG